MTNFQVKLLAWIFWILSACGAAYLVATGFQWLVFYATMNFIFMGVICFYSFFKAEQLDQQFKELHELTNERSPD